MILDDYFARFNYSYIHALGEPATNQLLSLLDVQTHERVLELGCGTGTSLVKTYSHFAPEKLVGVDTSESMLLKARNRLCWAGCKKQIDLILIEPGELPFEDESFDKIYIESVLGIQAGIQLRITLLEIFRVLKKEGKLVFNETIWTQNISKTEIEKFNAICLKHWGIIQANGLYPYLKDWLLLLEEIGFEKITCHKIIGVDKKVTLREIISKAYSYWGKIIQKVTTIGKNKTQLLQIQKSDFLQTPNIMEGVIFELIK